MTRNISSLFYRNYSQGLSTLYDSFISKTQLTALDPYVLFTRFTNFSSDLILSRTLLYKKDGAGVVVPFSFGSILVVHLE